jgi:hypothetical protein
MEWLVLVSTAIIGNVHFHSSLITLICHLDQWKEQQRRLLDPSPNSHKAVHNSAHKMTHNSGHQLSHPHAAKTSVKKL